MPPHSLIRTHRRFHLDGFCDAYDEKYATKHGMIRLERIRDICERFLPATFRPFSCTGFYLCPSCSQKRTLLFADVSRLVHTIITEFYAAAADKPLLSGVFAARQTLGDQLHCESTSSGTTEQHASRTKGR